MNRVPKSSVTPRQLGDVLGVTKVKMLNEIRSGELKAFKIGKRYLIEVSEAVDYLIRITHSVPPWLADAAARYEDESRRST